MPKHKTARTVDLESLSREYTEANIRRLGGYATSPNVRDEIAIEAIKILLDRGYGRPKQQKEHTGPKGGAINLVMRHIHEGKPPGEK